MEIEYEATFINIDKGEYREKLKKSGAELIRPEFLQKRIVFDLPKGQEIKGGWLRVRDEGYKITMSLKVVDGHKIENQKELCLNVDNFEKAVNFLVEIGCSKKAFQESKRELWTLDGVEITIDEWPFLEPYLEIEGKSEAEVKVVSEKLGLDYSKAMFCSADTLYSKKYDLPEDVINNQISKITFNGENPFLKR
ncbi:MAG: CYTH domain-containing protein [Candidatus Staskawiczbacteria bacterium]|nr:CYTH domain-containing protein [Candidatus Staskawiczbacteria bacterium]